jgi:hypothetical protein
LADAALQEPQDLVAPTEPRKANKCLDMIEGLELESQDPLSKEHAMLQKPEPASVPDRVSLPAM